MSPTIRPFTPDDYPALCDVHNASYTEYPVTEEELRCDDRTRDPQCRIRRFVATTGDAPVGMANLQNSEWLMDPRKFFFRVVVHPSHRGKGIGSALYEQVWEQAEQWEVVSMRTEIREDMEASTRFVARLGFVEEHRAFESRLDVGAFDFAPYEGAIQRVTDQGIEILTLREAMDDPDYQRGIYEMDIDAAQDIPFPEPTTPLRFEIYRERVFGWPNLLPDGFFLARHEGRYVGISQLWRSADPTTLQTGFTGVRRDYRRRGIALALKLCAIRYAREQGARTVRTDNSTLNRPMLSINERLGFVKQPAWIGYIKVVKG